MKGRKTLNQAFKALADPTRRKILDLLKEGDLTAGEIAEHFNMTKPSISHHLNALKNAELIQDEKKGQFVVYSLNTTVFQDLLTWVFTFTNKGKREMKNIFCNYINSYNLYRMGVCLATFAGYNRDTLSGGKVDGYSSKLYGMISMVGIMIALYVFLNVIPKIDPRKANYEKFSKAFMMMNNGILLLLFVGNIDIITSGLGYNLFINRVPELLVGVLFIVIGNYLPQCKPNFSSGCVILGH